MMLAFERIRDRELLRQFRAGDREAFAQLYRLHSGAVYRFVRTMTGDDATGAEITQDAFVWLIHHPGEYNPERGDLGGFLVGVARKLLKRRNREQQRWVPIDEASLKPAPAAEQDGGLDVELLRQAVAALPGRYREAVVLCDLESRTYDEAAAIADCAVGTVRSRLHRARALLAKKLAKKWIRRGCAV